MNMAEKLNDEIANTLRLNGALWSLREEWGSQAFQQAHAIRGMLAMNRIKPKKAYLDTAKEWAVMTMRLQGTQGHPDRYNMGYGLQLKNGTPKNWFVADCGTIAVALLDLASFLSDKDKLKEEILDSVTRFGDYIIKNWTLKDGSFSLGYLEYKRQRKEAYHCANAQSNLFLWPLWKATGEERFRKQAIKASTWLAKWTDYDSSYWGSPVHNRAYNCESLFCSLAHLNPKEKLYVDIVKNLEKYIISWAVDNYGELWFKDGSQSHAKDPLIIMSLLLYKKYIKGSITVDDTVSRAMKEIEKQLKESFAHVKKHNVSGMALSSNPESTRRYTDLFQNIVLMKFYTTDGLTSMALTVNENDSALYPFSY